LSAGIAIDKKELPPLREDSRIDRSSEGVVVPLLAGGSLTGVLELGKRSSGTAYSKLDLDLLDRLAKTAGPALQLAHEVQIREQNAKDQQRAANELDLARKIQQGLLPKTYPELPGWSFNAFYQPAREVGGDFYDWITLPDGRLGIVIGDVSDKGIPAALVMATCRTLLRSAAGTGSSPGNLLADVNNRLQPDIPSGMFVTCLVAFLDPESGSIAMANAGHNLPYVCHDREVAELMVRGMPLGLMPDMSYEEINTRIETGGVMVLTSDGLAESHCDGEMFGTGRVQSSLMGKVDDPMSAALDAHRQFVGDEWDQEDDMTVVTVGRFEHVPDQIAARPMETFGTSRI
jgi:serine phosphatase RsbU (regulator of sigma subunit)